MQQNYSTGWNNYEHKKETVIFMPVNYPSPTTFLSKPYPVREKHEKKTTETKNDRWLTTHDFFGALNY
jgi:hypothetical protein